MRGLHSLDFVPDVEAGRLLHSLRQEDQAEVLRELEAMCTTTKIRNPNAMLTKLIRGRQNGGEGSRDGRPHGTSSRSARGSHDGAADAPHEGADRDAWVSGGRSSSDQQDDCRRGSGVGFVPDAAAATALCDLSQEDQAEVLRELEAIGRTTKLRNPNAMLTDLIRRKQQQRPGQPRTHSGAARGGSDFHCRGAAGPGPQWRGLEEAPSDERAAATPPIPRGHSKRMGFADPTTETRRGPPAYESHRRRGVGGPAFGPTSEGSQPAGDGGADRTASSAEEARGEPPPYVDNRWHGAAEAALAHTSASTRPTHTAEGNRAAAFAAGACTEPPPPPYVKAPPQSAGETPSGTLRRDGDSTHAAAFAAEARQDPPPYMDQRRQGMPETSARSTSAHAPDAEALRPPPPETRESTDRLRHTATSPPPSQAPAPPPSPHPGITRDGIPGGGITRDGMGITRDGMGITRDGIPGGSPCPGSDASCWINVPGPDHARKQGPQPQPNPRKQGKPVVQDCLQEFLGGCAADVEVRDPLPDVDSTTHGWYILRADPELLAVLVRNAKADPRLRKWCFVAEGPPQVSLWVGNLRSATAEEIVATLNAEHPDIPVAASVKGSSFSGASGFVRCRCLRSAVALKAALERQAPGPHPLFTSYGPKVGFAPWQRQQERDPAVLQCHGAPPQTRISRQLETEYEASSHDNRRQEDQQQAADSALKNANKDLETYCRALEHQNKELSSDNRRLADVQHARLQNLTKENQHLAAALAQQEAAQEAEIQKLNAEKHQLEASGKEQKAKEAQLKNLMDEKEQLAAALNQQIAAQEAEIQKLNAEKHQLAASGKEQKAKEAQLKNVMDEKEQLAAALNQQIAAQEGKLKKMHDETQGLKAALMQQKGARAQQKVAQDAQMKTLADENQRLKAALKQHKAAPEIPSTKPTIEKQHLGPAQRPQEAALEGKVKKLHEEKQHLEAALYQQKAAKEAEIKRLTDEKQQLERIVKQQKAAQEAAIKRLTDEKQQLERFVKQQKAAQEAEIKRLTDEKVERIVKQQKEVDEAEIKRLTDEKVERFVKQQKAAEEAEIKRLTDEKVEKIPK